MKTSRKSIDSFLEAKEMAIAGVSRDPKKFGFVVYKDLKEKGFKVYPINPNTADIGGETCYSEIAGLPDNVKNLLLVTAKTRSLPLLREAVEKGISNVWIQQKSETPEALDYARSQNMNLVSGECILMHTDPVKGFHKFHRNLRKFFGGMPK
jgi:uncharacterized protein